MNILLLPEKFDASGHVIRGEQFEHIKSVLKLKKGDTVFCGALNGKMGDLTISEFSNDFVRVSGVLTQEPPPPLPVKLVLAAARPKMMRRIFRSVAMLGVKEIYVINTYKVEKSFWNSDLYVEKKYDEYLIQGLTQSKDTIVPKLYLKKRFKPFVEDELGEIIKGTIAIVAHPGDYPKFPQGVHEPLTLAIGPEGGFTNYEVNKFSEVGFEVRALGRRILRMETAVVSLISQHSGLYLA